jgi:pimeloyl-ACP methyl ester carboxylesterase
MNANQPADLRDRNERIFVLVHGAGQGAWAFGKVAWLLARDGHHVIAPDLPGHGLRARYPQSYLERPSDPDRFATEPSPLARLSAQDYADELTVIIRQLAERMPERQIVLLGHSFAGLTLSRAGEAIPELISRIVYLSAVMPAPRKSLFDYIAGPEFSASKIPPLLIGDPQVTGALRLDFRSADLAYRAEIKAAIAADVDDLDWQAVTSLLSPDVRQGGSQNRCPSPPAAGAASRAPTSAAPRTTPSRPPHTDCSSKRQTSSRPATPLTSGK